MNQFFAKIYFTVIDSDMNLHFQAFHIQQHVMFRVLLFHYNFSNRLTYVPKYMKI